MTPTALNSGDCICVGYYKPLACLGLSRPRLVTCILALGASTSAIGRLHHTSSLDHNNACHQAHLQVARHLASVLMSYNACLASQHIKGDENLIADLLSGSSALRLNATAYDRSRTLSGSSAPPQISHAYDCSRILSGSSALLCSTQNPACVRHVAKSPVVPLLCL
jgi:hypothetical protein